jgi:hypothetical protein
MRTVERQVVLRALAELGVSSKNIDHALHSKNREIRHLLGISRNYAERLGRETIGQFQ